MEHPSPRYQVNRRPIIGRSTNTLVSMKPLNSEAPKTRGTAPAVRLSLKHRTTLKSPHTQTLSQT